MAKLSPLFNFAMDISGIPATGGKLFTYAAGSTTKQNTYTDIIGATPQANPIVLNARGEPASPIWLTEGLSYKFVFTASTDSDPPASPIRTIDNISGVNDSSTSVSQWVASGNTPTYISVSSFTLAGDQTTNFHVGRRVKCTVTAGTVYGTIATSAYAALTTVGVTLDSGSLDSGLSAVEYGLLTNTNNSLPVIAARSGANNDITALNALASVPTVVTNAINAVPQIQSVTCTQSGGALTFGLTAGSLYFRSATLTTGVPTTVSFSALTLTLPSGGILGFVTTIQGRAILVAINNAGTVELAVISLAGGNDLSETGVISTTAIGAGSTANNVFYSTTARTGVAYRVVGAVDAVNTAGAWANPVLVQGYGGQALAAMSSLGYGQTWQAVTRTVGTTYYNTTGKPITLNYSATFATGNTSIIITMNGVAITLALNATAVTTVNTASIVIPTGVSYVLTASGGAVSSQLTWELR